MKNFVILLFGIVLIFGSNTIYQSDHQYIFDENSVDATTELTVLKSYSEQTKVGFRYPWLQDPNTHVTNITFNSSQSPSVMASVIVNEINNDPDAFCSAVSLGGGKIEFTSNYSGSEGNSTQMLILVDDDGTHFSSYILNFSGGSD